MLDSDEDPRFNNSVPAQYDNQFPGVSYVHETLDYQRYVKAAWLSHHKDTREVN